MKKKKKFFFQSEYKNPYFPKRKKIFPKKLASIGIIFFIIFWGGYIFSLTWNPVVVIADEEQLTEKQLKSINSVIQKYHPKTSILYPVRSLEEEIEKFRWVKYVSVRKRFPREIEIFLEKRNAAYVWLTQANGYLVDSEGYIIDEIDSTDIEKISVGSYNILRHKYLTTDLPLIYQKSQQTYNGNILIIKKHLKAIEKIISGMKSMEIPVERYEYIPEELSYSVQTLEGWKVYFLLGDDEQITAQLERLRLILSRRFELGKIVDYIDLRYGDKVYYK